MKERDIIQFERKGYFILDKIVEENGEKSLEFIRIPDGRAAGLALKSGPAASAVKIKAPVTAPKQAIAGDDPTENSSIIWTS